jgi:hypothetical protein
MTPETATKIYDILIEECGEVDCGWTRSDFLSVLANENFREYRFQGDLGFGGKLYRDHRKLWVNCYREDETPERLEMIRRANERLAEIKREA